MPEPLTVTKSEPLTVVSSDVGTWEDRGMAGMVWHPPGVPAGRDPTSQRADSAIAGGVPVIGSVNPEDLFYAYLGGRTVSGAVRDAVGLAPRALAGVRAALSFAAPAIKYQVAKSALNTVGVPSPIAIPLAIAVSGYRRGGVAPAAAEPAPAPEAVSAPAAAPAAAPGRAPVSVAPVETPPAPSAAAPPMAAAPTAPPAPAPFAAPVSAPPAAAPPPVQWGPPQAQQALITAGERLGYAVSPAELKVNWPRVQAGGPAEAVAVVQRLKGAAGAAGPGASTPAAPTPLSDLGVPQAAPTSPAASPSSLSPQAVRNAVGLAARRAKLTLSADDLTQADALVQAGQTPEAAVRAVAPPPPPAKLKVSAAEMRTYTELRRLGTSHQDAMAAIQAQRTLAAALGTPSSETVRQAVADRNVSGRWPAGTPGE